MIVGVLPFFHSFGFTVTIWLPLVTGCGAAYHPNPTELRRRSASWSRKYKGHFLLSTPTFCASYTRKCTHGAVRVAALRAGGRGEAARIHGRGVPREIRPGVAGRIRMHGDVAGGLL